MTSLIQNLGWTDLKTRRKNSRLLCMFKILNELVEIPINDHLIPADRRTCGGHNQAYKHIRANTTLGQNSFWHQTIPDWNFLSGAAIESKTVAHSRVSWSTRSASLFPPLQLDTPQWRAAGVFTQIQAINALLLREYNMNTIHSSFVTSYNINTSHLSFVTSYNINTSHQCFVSS